MVKKLFGTDGIREVTGHGVLRPEILPSLGLACGFYLKSDLCALKKEKQTVMLGRDTRASGPQIQEEFSKGLQDLGVQILDVGVCSSPTLAFLTRYYEADLGIMISASHNPAQYNGIKFFTHEGRKMSLMQEKAFEEFFFQQAVEWCGPKILGSQSHFVSTTPYQKHVLSRVIQKGLDIKGLKVVLDCGHGALWQEGRFLFETCGAEVVAMLGGQPSGYNINEGCGALYPQNLSLEVQNQGADLGFGFDGDGDRVVVVDRRGNIWDGDQILAALRPESGGIVGTVMSNLGLELFCYEQCLSFYRTDVGDRHVFSALEERGWFLGGESSGHVIDRGFLPTGDGLWGALCIADMIKKNPDLFPVFHPMPSIKCNIQLGEKGESFFLNSLQFEDLISTFRQRLSNRGRVVVRLSGTEPLMRILLEGQDDQEITWMAKSLKEQILFLMQDEYRRN